MANEAARPSFFPLRISQYVKAMRYASDVNIAGSTRVPFSAPNDTPMAANSSTNIMNAVAGSSAIQTNDLSGIAKVVADALWGRTITLLSVATVTGGTFDVDIYGWDYLGQRIKETITPNATTPVQGKKAFKTLDYAVMPATFTGALSLSLGWGPSLGLPYKAVRCAYETVNQAIAAAGTLIAPVLTNPQTATTGDPRGTYTPTSTMNSTNRITAGFDMQNDVDVNNVGGLHGVPHFGG